MDGIERIKQLASEIKDKPLLKIIDYLLSRQDMNDKYLNEEKTLKKMVEFIRANAQKQAKNGMAMIEDEVVFGWAIHYFDESNENLKLGASTKNSSNDTENKDKKSIQDNKKTQTKKTYVAEGQLSLFDL
ncbi:MAG: hypothetical protein HFI86_05725 [Bacilli bacterium]|nr:hypothetical protein [Bacilli bacterium]